MEKELCAPETRWMDQRKYYDFSKENVEELRQAAELKADGSENVYVVTCFSDRDKILSQVVKEA